MMLLKREICKGLVVVFLSSCLLENLLLVQARSTGAPVGSNPEICSTMTPVHQVPATVTASPYSISLDSESYKPGMNLTVTINTAASSPGLKGIFLQMRTAVIHEVIGSWSVTNSTNFKTVSCDMQTDNAVTHQNNIVKGMTNTFTWTPPEIGGPDIYVAATFVEAYATSWVNVTSPVIPDECKAIFGGVEICSNHGTCASKAIGLHCNCDLGYMGLTCQDMGTADACSTNMCMNGATCVPAADGDEYTCECTQGFTGAMCTTAENRCQDHTCRNGATCRPGSGEVMYTCACAEGFIGPLCDMERMITQASTTAHGTILTCSIVLTVTALGLAVIMNAVTIA